MLGPAGPSGSVMELRFLRGLGALQSFLRSASRSMSLWLRYGLEMKGSSLVGLSGRGMRSVSWFSVAGVPFVPWSGSMSGTLGRSM